MMSEGMREAKNGALESDLKQADKKELPPCTKCGSALQSVTVRHPILGPYGLDAHYVPHDKPYCPRCEEKPDEWGLPVLEPPYEPFATQRIIAGVLPGVPITEELLESLRAKRLPAGEVA